MCAPPYLLCLPPSPLLFPWQIASAVPLDVMPGEHDPSNYTLPQQPLHRCLLPLCSRYTTFRPVTNPYSADYGGVRHVVYAVAPRWGGGGLPCCSCHRPLR